MFKLYILYSYMANCSLNSLYLPLLVNIKFIATLVHTWIFPSPTFEFLSMKLINYPHSSCIWANYSSNYNIMGFSFLIYWNGWLYICLLDKNPYILQYFLFQFNCVFINWILLYNYFIQYIISEITVFAFKMINIMKNTFV